MTENMSQVPSYLFEQQPQMYMPSQYQQLPRQLSFQPGMQQFNPVGFDEFNGVPYDLTLSGYPIEPMGPSMPINYEQQLPTQTPNVPTRPVQFTSTSPLSCDAPIFQPQQTASSSPTNRQTLQFIPSQVLRNIPKKS
jgi:hypothetical protein